MKSAKLFRVLAIFSILSIVAIILVIIDNYIDVDYLAFSKESGFYESEFDLYIDSYPGASIYYTLDGSLPNMNSIRYTGPIHITDHSADQNKYANNPEMSMGYKREYVEEQPGIDMSINFFYELPDYPVDKCVVVSAVSYNFLGQRSSEVFTKIYFIGYDQKPEYNGLNIVSITSEPEGLFDYNNGIYVLGKDYYDNPSSDRKVWYEWGGNFYRRGIEAERIANVTMFDEERNIIFDKQCGIRIQGGSSRALMPKNLNIYAREAYDGNGTFPDIFGTGYCADCITFFMGGQDSTLKLRDCIGNVMNESTCVATRNYVPCIMFLNGEYWGVYFITEKYDPSFFAYYYDVDEDEVVFIKNSALESGNESDLSEFKATFKELKSIDLTGEEGWKKVCDVIDINSYIDYYATMIYLERNNDWPHQNVGVWKTRQNEDEEKSVKWRWVVFDLNSASLDGRFTEWKCITHACMKDPLFKNLFSNSIFRDRLYARIVDIGNTYYNPNKAEDLLDYYEKLLAVPMGQNNKRFYGEESFVEPVYATDGLTYEEKVAKLNSFFVERQKNMIAVLNEEFEVDYTETSLELSINEKEGGAIRVNGENVFWGNHDNWSGKYICERMVTIEAVPADGYCFMGFESDGIVMETNPLEMYIPKGGACLHAVFQKEQ